MRKFAVAYAVAFVAAAGVWASGPTTAASSGQIVRLSVGASVPFVLQENPSTGYRWHINKGQSVHLNLVQITDAGYRRGSSHRMGAPGTHRWHIKALASGSARIVFDYARSWEHGAPARRHTVRVDIR